MFGKRQSTSAALLAVAILAGACGGGAAPTPGSTGPAPVGTSSATAQVNPNGTTVDPDGFVRFPGEASRPADGHYYLVEDLCGQFTKTFMEGLTGKTFVKVAPPDSTGAIECDYFFSTLEQGGAVAFLILNLSYLNVANQKTGLLALGRSPTTDPSIPMDNWVVRAEDGHLVSIYFLLGTDKFLILDRTAASATEAEMLAYAAKLGAKMKDFR